MQIRGEAWGRQGTAPDLLCCSKNLKGRKVVVQKLGGPPIFFCIEGQFFPLARAYYPLGGDDVCEEGHMVFAAAGAAAMSNALSSLACGVCSFDVAIAGTSLKECS